MTRVLLVEDSADVLGVLQFELEWLGYQVDAVLDAAVALDIVRRTPPDVIVSDLYMPGMDGLEFIRQIREMPAMASVPAIALTGTAVDKDVRDALSTGFTTHLVKPVEPKELGDEIALLTTEQFQSVKTACQRRTRARVSK
jgi:two-component system CheB/CheR fusion protein